jgi:hypothetical protein
VSGSQRQSRSVIMKRPRPAVEKLNQPPEELNGVTCRLNILLIKQARHLEGSGACTLEMMSGRFRTFRFGLTSSWRADQDTH